MFNDAPSVQIGRSVQGVTYASVHAITLHADSRHWRKINLQRYPSVYDNGAG